MKNGIVIVGNTFVDIKGFPCDKYIPAGRNAGDVEIVHGGVGRNVAEDIANMELRPTFVSMVDTTAQGAEVIKRLQDHRVNTDYIVTAPDGMGIWLALFDETGDVVGSISKRPVMEPMEILLDEKGDEIFSKCDSVVVEIDMDQEVVKRVLRYAAKYHKRVYAVVANMSIAYERRDFLQQIDCFVCNLQEAEILFVDSFADLETEELADVISERIINARIPAMVVTLGSKGSVYADIHGVKGICEANKVIVKDTTGAGDAFCAGMAAGLTYGKDLPGAVEIGTRLAAAVITVSENVCPRFLPEELGIDPNFCELNPPLYGDGDLVK